MIGVNLTSVTNNANRLALAIQRNSRQMLEEFGQDHREIARDMMKSASPQSAPGQPPNVHSSEPNLETYAHVVDVAKMEVRSGPIKITSSVHYSRPLPNVLEFGGVVSVTRTRSSRRRNSRRGSQRRNTNSPRSITMRYRARPVIVPSSLIALERMRARLRNRGIAK